MANIKKGDLVQVITGRTQARGGDRGGDRGPRPERDAEPQADAPAPVVDVEEGDGMPKARFRPRR